MDDSGSMAPASGTILPERDWLSVTGGLLLGAASFAAMGYAAYQGWYTQALPHDWAFTGIGFGFLFFALGVFVAGYGWERGDVAKALKLTFFICAVALAALLAIILLLKSRGGAARGAAGVGKAAGEATVSGDFDAMPVISAVGSLFSDEREDRIEDPGRRDEPFQVTCRGCGARFAPAPPRAACPFCGEAALVS